MEKLLELKKKKEEAIKEYEEEKSRIRHVVLKEIKDKIADFSFSASELGFTKEHTTSHSQKSNKSNTTNKTRKSYKNPEDGKVWKGKGPTPKWLKDFEESGRKREEFEYNEHSSETQTADDVEFNG